jgi:GT2 family glycosyltransferase
MKLSIIITTRDRKDALMECIESIRNSTFKDFELMIIDDASSDGTASLKSEDLRLPSVQIYHSQEQLMLVQARNKGRELARGEYLLFIDDDNVIDSQMIEILVKVADRFPDYGLLGPSMFYHDTQQKYLDYQSISFYTGKTSGCFDTEQREICPSDGIPNVFLIKREVFERVGAFDATLLQTFTEPDFAFHAREHGFKCGMVKMARTLHKVSAHNDSTPRGLGAEFKQKAYCLMRNRSVMIKRYGSCSQKWIYFLFFSWVWPAIYSLRMLQFGRFDLIRLYWMGFRDGIYFMMTGKLINSLSRIL